MAFLRSLWNRLTRRGCRYRMWVAPQSGSNTMPTVILVKRHTSPQVKEWSYWSWWDDPREDLYTLDDGEVV